MFNRKTSHTKKILIDEPGTRTNNSEMTKKQPAYRMYTKSNTTHPTKSP